MNGINPILNIGRAIGDTGAIIPVTHVIQAIEQVGLRLVAMRLVESDTEPTVVAEVREGATREQIHAAAELLGQDAIGAFVPGLVLGYLIGPRADAWGEFNPEFFFTLDGRRLSETAGKSRGLDVLIATCRVEQAIRGRITPETALALAEQVVS